MLAFMKKQKLSELKPGVQGRLVSLELCDRSFRQKLLAMGLIPGVMLEVIRTAPLGDPMQICVRGFHLSLRKIEASAIYVERLT